MAEEWFDENAAEYDAWFRKNQAVLESEVRLLAHLLGDRPGRTVSIGCGTGLFEMILREEYDIDVDFGVEPARGMADVARKRGIEVEEATAEKLPYDPESFDTALMNGIPSYVDDLETAFYEGVRVLKPGGRLIMLDVPAESSYGLLYRLAAEIGDWEDDFLARVAPLHPYPIEFARAAKWRTTEEKMALFREAGLEEIYVAQTLTRHPKFSDDEVEHPSEGFDRGDYVGIRGVRST